MSTKTRVCTVAELPIGQSKRAEINEREIALFHTDDGFFALDNTCPHKGGPLAEGTLHEGKVTCPWHQWHFELKTGVCTNIPGQKVNTYKITIENDELFIES